MFIGDVVCPPLLNWKSSVLVGDECIVGGMCKPYEPEGLVTPWHGPPLKAVKLLSEARTITQISFINNGLVFRRRLSTTPCPKHVFLKYFSIKAELLDANITADSGSKFCIGNI